MSLEPRVFSNNAQTVLTQTAGVEVWDMGTLHVEDGTVFRAISGSPYNQEMMTLLDPETGDYEIVRCWGNVHDNLLGVSRGQEGTTIRAWPVGTKIFGGITAGTLELFLQTLHPGESIGAGSITIQSARANAAQIASGAGAFAVGNNSTASGSQSTALGHGAAASGDNSAALGHEAEAAGNQSSAIGRNAHAWADESLALQGGQIRAEAEYAIAIGPVEALSENTTLIYGLPVAQNEVAGASTSAAAWEMSASEVVVWSANVDAKFTGYYSAPMPDGVLFFVTEVGLVTVDSDSVTEQPFVRFGDTNTDGKFVQTVQTSGLENAGNRQRWQSLESLDGVYGLSFEITTAATADTLLVRAYWKGFAVYEFGHGS